MPFVIILGVVLASPGPLLLAFAGLLALSSHGQPAFGSFATPNERYQVHTHAVTVENLEAMAGPDSPEFGRGLGQVTVRARSATPDDHIFIGVAAQADVSTYLSEVPHTELVGVKFDPFRPQYRDTTTGSAQPAPPGHQSFWLDSTHGPGTQQIEVDLRQGTWAVVVMNRDGHAAVAADLQAEVTLPWFRQVTEWTFRVGVALQTVGAALILIGAFTSGSRRAGR